MTETMIEDRSQYKKGLWTAEEDRILIDYVSIHGKGRWNRVAKKTGLKRSGKSCRLRWMNYLCPNVKRGRFSEEEEDLIIRLHKLLGNRWSLIAKRVPGRTDNQVKNYWNTHLSKKLNVHQKQRVSSRTKSRESASSEVALNSENSTYSGNTNSADNFWDDIVTQKCDQELITQEPVMKDGGMNPLWIIDEAIEMTDLMELNWYSFDLD